MSKIKPASNKPAVKLDGLTFFPVPEFDGPIIAFGAPEKAFFHRRKLPDVPREYEQMVSSLFYKGGALPELSPQVDRTKATRAMNAWLSSFQPSYESKTATAAYALWVWTTLDE